MFTPINLFVRREAKKQTKTRHEEHNQKDWGNRQEEELAVEF